MDGSATGATAINWDAGRWPKARIACRDFRRILQTELQLYLDETRIDILDNGERPDRMFAILQLSNFTRINVQDRVELLFKHLERFSQMWAAVSSLSPELLWDIDRDHTQTMLRFPTLPIKGPYRKCRTGSAAISALDLSIA